MARIGFPYTLEMHKHIKKEMDKGFGAHLIWKAWPDIWKEGDTPSMSSIRRRRQRIELLGIEGALRIGGEQKPTQEWTKGDIKDIKLGYRECNGAAGEAARLIIGDKEFIKHFNLPSRNISDIQNKISILQQEGQLESKFPTKGGGDLTNTWIERWKALGFTIIDYPDIIRSYTPIIVRCSSGHMTETVARYILQLGAEVCSVCLHLESSFVGEMPTGPEPALVYLLIFPEWKKCKLGYAQLGKSSSPEEAIHRTSKSRKYPYPYTIGAYDLSTKTKAALLEEELKKITFENKAFTEQQEFAGHTEFRTWETIKQLRKMGIFKTWLK